MSIVIGSSKAASIIGIHVETLRRLVRQGEIRPLRGFRLLLFDKDYVESLPKRKMGRPPKNR